MTCLAVSHLHNGKFRGLENTLAKTFENMQRSRQLKLSVCLAITSFIGLKNRFESIRKHCHLYNLVLATLPPPSPFFYATNETHRCYDAMMAMDKLILLLGLFHNTILVLLRL